MSRYHVTRIIVRVGFWVGIGAIGYLIPPFWWT